MTTKLRLIIGMTILSLGVHATEPAEQPEKYGWYHHLGDHGKVVFQASFLALGIGSAAMAAYFQTLQLPTLMKMEDSLQDDKEDGVALEDKRCGQACMRNSQIYREYGEHTINVDVVATIAAAFAAINFGISAAILGAMACNLAEKEKYIENVHVFSKIGVISGMIAGIMNLAAVGMMAKLGVSYRDGISLPTLGKLQMALSAAIGAVVPTVPYVVFGFVKISQAFYDRFWGPQAPGGPALQQQV
ncbi:MAG: hypothetical protein V4534_05960 [Myxococcota bacterium]